MNYIDLQVNGYGGVDFNADDLDAEKLHRACETLARDGVNAILATIITERVGVMCDRIRRIAKLRDADPLAKRLIAGLHVEGPFISGKPGYLGAHPADATMPASVEVMKRMLDAGGGLVKLVTLAPERDVGFQTISFLAKQGVRVSAGHTDASLDELRGAIDAGLALFTHLGNGCPMQMNRHDNVVQRALSLRDRLRFTFIADGAHVPYFALRNYIDLVGIDRTIVVSDAIAPAGVGPGRYTLGRWDLVVGEDLVARAPDGSHLIGSAVSMKQSAANLKRYLGFTDEQIRHITFTNAAAFLR